MEAAESANVEAAILWRLQTILETLEPGDLAELLHQVGLAGAIGELKSEVERMETVVNGVKGRAVGNKPLARCLARVKELMYEADDVVDELDYFRLQQQVQGVVLAPATEPEDMVGDAAEQVDASANTLVMLAPAIELEGLVGDGAEHADASASTVGVPSNSGRKNRPKVRDYFHIIPAVNGEPAKAKCIDCGTQVLWGHGTSVLHKHRHSASCKKKRVVIQETPNSTSASDSVQNGGIISTNADSEGRKRMRTESNVANATHPCDKAKFSKRIHEIALELGSIRGSVIEYLKDSVASFDQYQSNNTSDTQVRTSGSHPGKVYGRYKDKNNIMSVIEAAKSANITVLPIVGIVGIGKTALAKLVYNDRFVKNQFERIWVWVSNIFDEVRVTREILDALTLADSHEGSPCSKERYEGVINYTKLQEVLNTLMACQPKKVLLVLDAVNDCIDGSRWKDLLDALRSSCIKGNMIIVTARNLSIAQRLGTVEPVMLGALKDDDFCLLFKSCVVDDNNYKEHLDYKEHLEIGYQIAGKLKGNPLAAESAAEMLREQPTIGHWKRIARNGVWESLQLRGGIVTILKNSYYQLPYQLQQCFLLCSIFPSNHEFHIDDVVSMWISLGFVKSIEIGQDYVNDLVNSCILEQVRRNNSIPPNKKCYVMCGIMHEFARLVSRNEFATIGGLQCKEVLPTVRHFSILTDSVYHKDECGVIIDNVKFGETLKSIVSSARRLRTLILIGNYNSLFFQYVHTFLCNLVNCTHLRYLKLENKGSGEALPISLSKFYHLEVLDVGCRAIVHDMSDLISMRHLVMTKGACGAFSPARSASLQTIRLEDCKGWEIFPSLERLSSLKKLKLRSMPKVTELLIPSLEELVLIDMPKLDRCVSNSMREFKSSLRVLEIRRCQVLKAFPFFESCVNFEIEQKSWLPNVNELTVHECPHLGISNPLPPSSSFCKLSITDVSTLPSIEGSSYGELKIGTSRGWSSIDFLDNKILSFHNLRNITRLEIVNNKNLCSISLDGFRQLICLKRLEIKYCRKFFSLDVSPMHTHEDMAATNLDALPSLECLYIISCGITGEWLSVILQHVQALEELHLVKCKHITGLLIDGKDDSLSNFTLPPRALSQGNPDDAWTRPCPDKLLRIPSNLIPSLKKMAIICSELIFQGNKEGFSRFSSLEELRITRCPKLISSLVHEDEINGQANGRWLLPSSLGVLDISHVSLRLQPCFPEDLTRLTVLEVSETYGLKSLQLCSCTALEKLTVGYRELLDALEGVQSLYSLRYLKVLGCPVVPLCSETLSMQGYEMWPRLERLCIDSYSFLTMAFCKNLITLQCLQFKFCDLAGLIGEQETALQLLVSLQLIQFHYCSELLCLPVCLHRLPFLKRLEINHCPKISMLPGRGLPPLLEELDIWQCSKELIEQCRMLATIKLKVIIDGEYVNDY